MTAVPGGGPRLSPTPLLRAMLADERYGLHPGVSSLPVRHVDAGGTSTAYVEAGNGPPVVLLHGVAESKTWMLPLLCELRTGHRVIAIDLPGHGDSSPLAGRFGLKPMVGWLVGALDALGVDRADIVGNSLGGRIGLEAALRHPRRVDRLALVATPLVVGSRRHYVPLATLVRPELAAAVPLSPLRRVPAIDSGLRRLLAWAELAQPEQMAAGVRDALAEEFLQWMSTPAARVLYVAVLRRVYLESPERFWSRCAALERPTIFLLGEGDRVVSAGQLARVAEVLPSAQSVIVTGCGHAPLHEDPALVVKTVASFLARDDP